MEYNPDVHSIECPKCGHGMEEITYGGDLAVDRCTNCQGLWFDHGEEKLLKSKWMGDALDTGDAAEGKKWDAVDDIACPRCGSTETTLVSQFGSTPCKSSYRCADCLEPFEYFKCI